MFQANKVTNMDSKQLEFYIRLESDKIWNKLCKEYSVLSAYNPPKIELCNRIYVTAGACYQEQNRIKLARKFFVNNSGAMFKIILPHELAHQADYHIFGTSEKRCGHGRRWKEIMLQLGLDANPYHDMTL